MTRLSEQDFEKAVGRALDRIADEFHAYLENVLIVVEDEPTAEDLESMGLPEGEPLLGAYYGVPLGEKSFFDVTMEPDRIVIYKGPLEEMCETLDELVEEIEITVIHEIAHHFDIDEETLERYGYH